MMCCLIRLYLIQVLSICLMHTGFYVYYLFVSFKNFLFYIFSSVKMIPFGSLFSGLISATASICCKSILKMHSNLKGLEAFDVAMTFYFINVGMASSNKSSCTSLFKGIRLISNVFKIY